MSAQHEPDTTARNASLREQLAAAGMYALLSVVATWPTALRFTSEGLGEMYFDRVQNLWNLWWVKVALLDRHTNPFQTDLLLYPQGADLYFHTLNLPGTLLALPVQLAFGVVAAYNFSMLLALTLSGYAGYRLVRYVTGNVWAALIGGIIYGFSPLVLFQLRGHVQIISLQWMALCIEFYLRAWDAGRRRDALLAGIFFALALLTVGYYEVLLAVFFGAHLTWAVITGSGGVASRLAAVARRATRVALWAGLAALPFVVPYLLGAFLSLQKGQVIIPDVTDVSHTIAESSDILSFVVPNRDHWLMGVNAPWWNAIEPTIHERTYLGVMAVTLAAIGVWRRRRDAATWLWVAICALGIILALGPTLQFNRIALGPAPLALVADVPPFNLVRGPERFAYLSYLGLAVLGGWGVLSVLRWAQHRWPNRGRLSPTLLVVPVILALLLLDLPFHARYTEAMGEPPSMTSLRADPTPGALLELPFTQHGWIDAPRMLYQVEHGRPITSGYLSRHVVDPYVQACSPLQAFADHERLSKADIISPTAAGQLLTILREAGVGFISIYKKGYVQPAFMSDLPQDHFEQYAALAEGVAAPAYEDDIAKIYRVRPASDPMSAYLQLGPDWHEVEESYGLPFRWVNGSQADFCVFSPAPIISSLSMQVASFGQPRHLQLWVGDRKVLDTEVAADGALHEVKTEGIEWPSGGQRVRVVSAEGSVSPQSLGQGSDKRQLSLGFADIRLGESPSVSKLDASNKLSTQGRAAIVALVVLLGVALSVSLNLLLPPVPLKEDMPATSYRVGSLLELSDNTAGLYSPETTPDGVSYAWTHPHATLNFAYGGNTGRNAQVAMRLAANRPPQQPPANVTISLNGHEYPSFTAADAFTVYTFTLDTRQFPNPYMHPANIQVDITSTTFTTPQDPRQLGVALDWIEVRAEKSRFEIALEVVIWAATLLIVLLVGLSRFGLFYSVIYCLGAVVSFTMLHLTYLPRAVSPLVELGLAGLAWVMSAWLAPRDRPLWGFGLAACSLWLVAVGGRSLGDWQVDDAYISYRYAWNLVHGDGLVFNPGEVVEGYTNFLWTLLAAAAIAAWQHPAEAALAANIALSIGLVGLTYYLIARLITPGPKNHAWPIMGAVLLSVDVALVTYGARGSGMESVLFAFLTLLSVALLWACPPDGRQSYIWRGLGGVALALAVLTRPEGLLVGALLLGVRAWQDRKAGRSLIPLFLSGVAPFLVIVLPYQAWRILFYGYLLPNTFYAKTGATLALAERGADYTWQFVGAHWLLVLMCIVGATIGGLLWLRSRRKKDDGQSNVKQSGPVEGGEVMAALALLVAVYTLYIVIVGGDWIAGYRFFVPLLAPMVMLAIGGAHLINTRLPSATPVRYGFTVLLALVALLYVKDCLTLLGPQGTIATRTQSDILNTEWWGSAGLWLRDNTPPQTLTAAQGAGAIAYYSQRPVIDMLGLNDLHIGHAEDDDLGAGKIGHEKRDPAYVLGRQPSYILVVWEDYFTPVEDRLKSEYEQFTVRTPTGSTVPWLRFKGNQ